MNDRHNPETVRNTWDPALINRVGLGDVDFEKGDGLIPCVVQDVHDGTVLMVAWMNRDAFEKTLSLGKATFWSRSRNELWTKGETSGNVQYVRAFYKDCDGDTLLLQVEGAGPACHTGNRSCFYRRIDER